MFPPVVSDWQDGGGLAAPQEAYTDLPDTIQGELGFSALPSSPTQDTGTGPLTSSPAKARMRMDAPQPRPPAALIKPQAFNPLLSGQAPHSSMATFPTSGQPVIDTTLKDMLMSLQTSLMTDLSSMIRKITTDMWSLGNRVSNIETGMTECTTTMNDLIDTSDEIKEEQEWVRAKLADLEDRSRQNDVKLRGVPETILLADLSKYAKDLTHTILLDASSRDIIIDRSHRIAKPTHLAASVPRDVLMRAHFFHIKEKLIMEARSKSPLPRPYEGVHLFPDLSKYMLQLRRNLYPVTKGLHNHKILYKWRYPATLLITKNGITHSVSALQKGMCLLHDWGIIIEPPKDEIPPLQQRRPSQSHHNQGSKNLSNTA